MTAARTGSIATKPMSHSPLRGGVEHLAGGVIGDEFDRNAEPLAKFARQIGRDALGLAGGFVLLRQHAVAEIDGGAQFAGRGEVLKRVSIGGHGHSSRLA